MNSLKRPGDGLACVRDSCGPNVLFSKASFSDPVANKRAVFKTFIGTIGAMLLYGYRQLQDEFLRRVQAFARVFGSDYVYDVLDGALFHEYQRLAENRRFSCSS
ncbi:MAG: hypothetical protein IPO99_08535 [Nitrospira sp.]|nr:hypothetical protein [Nitrospira sp.]